MGQISTACFCLQGFGNDLLLALQNCPRVTITTIYTRPPEFTFSYYDCEPIERLAERMKIPVIYIPKEGEWECREADLALVSSFHRFFKRAHLSKFQNAVNIHPSLLPLYKGATPTPWMLKNGERIAGITAHLMTENIDEGPIIFRRRMLNPFLCDNEMRKALSFLSREAVRDIVEHYPDYKVLSVPKRNAGNRLPARKEEDAVLRIEDIRNIDDLIFHIKAFTNYPMPKLLIDGKLFVVDFVNPRQSIEIKVKRQRFYILGYWAETGTSEIVS